jgi:ABC-type transport system involved in cytochrome c biogenesis permease subunit
MKFQPVSRLRSIAQWVAVAVAVLVSAPRALAAPAQRQVQKIVVENPRQKPWPDEAVAAFGRIPVQDRGRVKPLSTFAGFRMLNINGKRGYRVPEGFELPTGKEKLDPVRWLLDVCLFPEQARHYEIFVVDDRAVLDAIGLQMEGRKRRDRYSFAQLQPHTRKLEEEAQKAFAKRSREEKLDSVESQTIALRESIIQYDLLESMLPTLQTSLGESPSERLLELFPEGKDNAPMPLGLVLSRWPVVVEWMKAAEPSNQTEVLKEFSALESTINVAWGNRQYAVALIPPADSSVEDWRNPGELIDHTMGESMTIAESEYGLLDELAAVWMARGSVDDATAAIVKAQASLEAAATARGEFTKASLEQTYYKGDFFYRALLCFLFAFVLAALSWTTARGGKLGKRLNMGVWGLTTIGLVLAVAGVTIRCVLLSRPPVATLYETVLFITSVAVFVCLLAEKMTKERIALASAAALGAAGMFLSMKYELVEAASQGDTMGGLVAVLNTNFWLATHVTTVTMGYSAGLLAAALAHVWIVMRLFRGASDRGQPMDAERAGWYRRFARMIYGVLCFGLLFSVVGTILGGVWANDSWGRFWGWDPKENGALMIVLFELVILHARMGGYIKDFGVCVLAVMGGAVVAFSWWHVNQLGVGLHSYGFTAGVLKTLWAYYGFVGAFVLVSGLGYTMLLRPRPKLEAA